jgi:hypothetical protein
MNVRGAEVLSAPIEGGTSLVFTTPGDFAELRRRVREVTRLHGLRVLDRGTPFVASTDDIAHGIRLNIRPIDQDRGRAVHDHATARAGELARGACPAVGADEMIAWVATPDAAQRPAVSSR